MTARRPSASCRCAPGTGVLVTGGAGYVGSHVVRRLTDDGYRVVVIDDLSTGHRDAIGEVPLLVGGYENAALLDDAFGRFPISFVIHLAASSEVAASMTDPSRYFRNNVCGAPFLLDAAVRHGISGFVLSSSAAVYGEPKNIPVSEDEPAAPVSTYGETKRIFEEMLAAYERAHGLRWMALRYFNAAGAHPAGDIGEDHAPETHLIPRLLTMARSGLRQVPVSGRDYPTRDGSCVRDYVHVCDLARAHVEALPALQAGATGPINLGSGSGTTVLEIVETIRSVTGFDLLSMDVGRRPGDPAELVACIRRAREVLGWTPQHSSVAEIVTDAWRWHRTHPVGFPSTVAQQVPAMPGPI